VGHSWNYRECYRIGMQGFWKTMNDIRFLFAWVCFTGLLGFVGILMLIASGRSMRLLHTVLRMNAFSNPSGSRTAQALVQWRVAGLLTTAVSLCLMFLPFYWRLSSPSKEGGSVALAPHVVGRWILSALLVVIFAFGFYLSLNPHGIVRISRLMMPDRSFPDATRSSDFVVVRFIGICFVGFVVYSGLMRLDGRDCGYETNYEALLAPSCGETWHLRGDAGATSPKHTPRNFWHASFRFLKGCRFRR